MKRPRRVPPRKPAPYWRPIHSHGFPFFRVPKAPRQSYASLANSGMWCSTTDLYGVYASRDKTLRRFYLAEWRKARQRRDAWMRWERGLGPAPVPVFFRYPGDARPAGMGI